MSSPGKGPIDLIVISAASADETQGQPIQVTGRDHVTFYVQGSADTISSGVLTLEEAAYDPSKENAYGGTWSSITTMNAADVTGGAQKAIHLTVASYGWIRARITTAVGGGGTLTVRMVAD